MSDRLDCPNGCGWHVDVVAATPEGIRRLLAKHAAECPARPEQQIADLMKTDPMVPPGHVEVRDPDGKLLSRHRLF